MTALPIPLPADSTIEDQAPAPARPARMRRWQPKKWESMHEMMVAMSVAGASNKEIAEKFGYSAQQVSNILTCAQATLTRRKLLENLQKGIEEKIPQRLEQLADKAVQRVAEVLFDDDLASRAPFQVADRSITVLKGLGKLTGESEKGKGNQNTFIMGDELAKRLLDGMAMARQAHELHAPKASEAVEVEGKVVE